MVSVLGKLVPFASVAVTVIIYFPGVLNVTGGFWDVLVAGLTLGGTPPKFQLQEKGPVPVADPLNETTSGAHPVFELIVMETTGTCALTV